MENTQATNQPIVTLIERRAQTARFKDVLFGMPDVAPRPIIDYVARVKLSNMRRMEAREKVRAAYDRNGEEGA